MTFAVPVLKHFIYSCRQFLDMQLINRLFRRNNLRLFKVCLILLATQLFAACSVIKHVPDDKYLLNKVEVKSDEKSIPSGDLTQYIKQQPNKRILGFRFHLRVYSLSSAKKATKFGRVFRSIGEPPVIYDSVLVRSSKRNLELYLESKGYYNAVVKDSIKYFKKKADVLYFVYPERPYHISKLNYYIEDTTITALVLADTANRLINPGDLFDTDVLQQERQRIETFLKNSGYYTFSKDYISFTADTSYQKNEAELTLIIKRPVKIDSEGNKVAYSFKRYKIKRIFIYPNYDPIQFIQLKQHGLLDTVYYKDVQFIFSNDPGVKNDAIYNNLKIKPGMLYSQDIVQNTQNSLSSIPLFKFVSISFRENPDTARLYNPFVFEDEVEEKDSLDNIAYLDCYIQLTPHTLQSYQLELVGTNTTGSLGAEGNLTYQHKNIFKGAEVFNIKLRGLIESTQQQINFNNTLEVGGSMSLNLPKYIGLFSSKLSVSKYAPKTQIAASYSFQRRPDYTRTITSLQFGYIWKSGRFLTHNVNPMEINAINIARISSDFQEQINNSFLKYSYINQIVTVSSYGLTFNNQNIQRLSNYTYFKYNLEFSGNILDLTFNMLNRPKDDNGTYKILNTAFSQFVRTDINYTYHQVIDENNTFAYRFFAGIGYPYGNSKALPFEKSYFSGGANSIRAWQARSLGPGSFYQENEAFPSRTSDIRLEANIEYRFKMFWKLEGALFFDAGNIWSLPSIDDRLGAAFRFNTFYKQVALGSGFGFRINLGFFILRTDFGYKVFDPQKIPGTTYRPWVPFQQKFMLKDFTFNFGIGYPF